MLDFDINALQTPCYVIEEKSLEHNLKILYQVQQDTDCRILLAQKAYSTYSTYPLVGKYLCGTTASSLNEAKLGATYMNGEVHIFAPAYRPDEIDEILEVCDHIVFNSLNQWNKYKDKVMEMKKNKKLDCGLRINPEYSEIEVDMYNPCLKNSRFGIRIEELEGINLTGIDGLHFHTMCEQGSDVLKRTLAVVEEKFGYLLHQMKWVNFGGGHWITKDDYDIVCLKECICSIRDKYQVQVYLEPGEAVAINAGYLISEVLETGCNGMRTAIMDTSAACHMPDVLEMPYRPEVMSAKNPKELSNEELKDSFTYRLGGPTCLSGDVIGDYTFDYELQCGERLVFRDMAMYTTVKTNTFNGINLPTIYVRRLNGQMDLIREFSYEDFIGRL